MALKRTRMPFFTKDMAWRVKQSREIVLSARGHAAREAAHQQVSMLHYKTTLQLRRSRLNHQLRHSMRTSRGT